jgi:hypothetical protein
METVNVPRELLEAIMALEWKGPLALTCYMNLELVLKQPAAPDPSVEICKAAFKMVPDDQAYELLNELTYWHEEGKYK